MANISVPALRTKSGSRKESSTYLLYLLLVFLYMYVCGLCLCVCFHVLLPNCLTPADTYENFL